MGLKIGTAVVVAIVGASVAPAATPLGWTASRGPHYRLAAVNTTLRVGHPMTVCRSTKGIPASVSLLTWARVNGAPLPAAGASGLSQYFAGRGTLVQVFARSTTAPVCVKAITWQRATRLRVTFKLDGGSSLRADKIRRSSGLEPKASGSWQ